MITTTPAVQALADALTVPDGGFTVDVATNAARARFGYAVSVFPDRETVLNGPVEPDALTAYVNDHADLLLRPGYLFGGWCSPHTGAVYLDVSVWVAGARQAAQLAREHGQLAFFDLRARRSVTVGAVAL